MESLKFLNDDGERKKFCMCLEIFRKLREKVFDYFFYTKIMGKAVENLTILEEMFIMDFDFKNVKDHHWYMTKVKAKYKRLDKESIVKCGYCGREYLVPECEIVVRI